MTDDMIKRVARVMAHAAKGELDDDWNIDNYDELPEHGEWHPDIGIYAPGKLDYLRAARAVIEAMREPTEAMRCEGESAATFGIGRVSDDEAIVRVWQWMIDTAVDKRPS